MPVAPHGPILRESEATPSRKFFKHLPGSPGPVFGPPKHSKIKHPNYLKTTFKIGVGGMGGALTIRRAMLAWLLGVLDPLPNSCKS